MKTIEPRTYEDFTEEMIDKGRTKKQVLAVAQSTRWAGLGAEIVAYGKKYIKFSKKSKKVVSV